MRCRAARDRGLLFIVCISKASAHQHAHHERHQHRNHEARMALPQQGQSGIDLADVQRSNIDAVVNAAQELVNQKFPDGAPSDINLQTVAWPSSYEIGGTVYTAMPTMTTATSTSATETSASETSSTASSTASSTSSETSKTSSPTPKSTKDSQKQHEHDKDRQLAMAFGILFGLGALFAVFLAFFTVWRRKRQTGSYFKPAKCADCDSAGAPSMSYGNDRSEAWEANNQGTRSWLAAARTIGSMRSGGSRDQNSIRGNFPEMTESAERLPIPVDGSEVSLTDGDALFTSSCGTVSSHGTSRLQKSRPPTAEGFVALHEVPPDTHELSADGLTTINEMEGDSSHLRLPSATSRRVSSFPFMFSLSMRGASPAPTTSRSNSNMTRSAASELDAEECTSGIRRRLPSLTRLAINPMIMTNVAGSETNLPRSSGIFGATVSTSDEQLRHGRALEMDGESPTRRVSTFRSLQPNTFTVNKLDTEVQSFNGVLESGSDSGETTDTTSTAGRGVRAPQLSPTSTATCNPFLEDSLTAPTSLASRAPSDASRAGSSKSQSSSAVEESIGHVSSAQAIGQAIKTTEVILPARPPYAKSKAGRSHSVSSTSNSMPATPMLPQPPTPSERDTILSKVKNQCPSPRPVPAASKPAWAPAGAYAMAPIWRKKRPAPLTPELLQPTAYIRESAVSPLPASALLNPGSGSSASSWEDIYKSTTLKAPEAAIDPSASPLVSPLLRASIRMTKPRALEPDWLPVTLRASNSNESSPPVESAAQNESRAPSIQESIEQFLHNVPPTPGPDSPNLDLFHFSDIMLDDNAAPPSAPPPLKTSKSQQTLRHVSRLDPGSPYPYANDAASKSANASPVFYPSSAELQQFRFQDSRTTSSANSGAGPNARSSDEPGGMLTQAAYSPRVKGDEDGDGDDGWKPSALDQGGNAGHWALMA